MADKEISHLDSAENIFFARELETIKARSYDVPYPKLLLEQFVPVSHEADPGTETITYNSYDYVGFAKLISAYGDDLPTADVKGVQTSSPVHSIGNGYKYSRQEIRNAAKANKPLAQMKANAARETHMKKRDAIGSLGDTATGMGGFLTNPNVTIASAGAKTAGGTTWAKATPDEILVDLNLGATTIIGQSLGIEEPTDLILPLTQYTIAAQARLPNTGLTVLQFFQQSNPWIKSISSWYRLTAAGAGGTDRMVFYTKSPDKLQFEVPMEMVQYPPQERGLQVVVPCESRVGGTNWYYPLSGLYVDGI